MLPTIPTSITVHLPGTSVGLPGRATTLYAVLYLTARNSGEVCISLEELGALVGMTSGGTLTAILRRLAREKLIEILPGKRQMHYRVRG